MQVLQGPEGTSRLGLLTQLELTPDTMIAGPGFNEQTIRIRNGEHFYYVFREDLATSGVATPDIHMSMKMAAAG